MAIGNIGTVRGILELQDKFTGTLQRAQAQLRQAGQTMQATGRQMQSAGLQMTAAITLPIAAVGKTAIGAFANFDAAMTQSTAIMGDLSDEMRTNLATAAREMAQQTTFSAEQAAESYFFLASAGLDAATSLEALPKVAAFAQAGMFDMATATDLLTDAQSALGLVFRDTETGAIEVTRTMAEMERVSNVLVKANTLANATVEQFSTALTREAGAALKSFNIDVEEGVAVLAAFADQGVKAEVAGTGLSRILRLMTTAAVKNAEAYRKLGVEVFDANGNINNMADIVEDLEDALGDMDDQTRVAALDMLGFKARVQGVILPLLGTSDAIRRYESELRQAGDTTQEVADNQLESFQAQMGLMRDRIKEVAIDLGGTLAQVIVDMQPTFDALIERLQAAVDWFQELSPAMQKVLVVSAAVAAALGPVLFVVGGLTAALGALATPVAALLGFIFSPAGLVAAAGALLLAWEPFRNLVVSLYATVWPALIAGVKAVVGWFRNLWGETEKLRSFLGNLVEVIVEDLVGAFMATVKWIGSVVSAITGGVKSWLDWMGITQAAKDLLGLLASALESVWGWLKKATTAVTEWVGGMEGFLSVLRLVSPGLASAIDKMREWAAEAARRTEAEEKGKKALESYVAGWKAWNEFTKKGAEAAGEAADALDDLGDSTDEVAEGGELAASALKKLTGEFKAFQAQQKKIALGNVTEFLESLPTGAELMDPLLSKLQEWESIVSSVLTESEKYVEAQERVVELAEELGIESEVVEEILRRMRVEYSNIKGEAEGVVEETSKWEQALADALAELILGAEDFEDLINQFTEAFARAQTTEAIEAFGKAFDKAKEDGATAAEAVAKAWDETSAQVIAGLAAIAASADDSFGEVAEIALDVGAAIAAFYTGNYVAAVGFAVSAIVGIVGALGSEFKSLEEEIEDAFKALDDGIATLDEFITALSFVDVQLDKAIAANVGYAGSLEEIEEAANVLAERLDDIVDFALDIGGEAVLVALGTFANRIRAIGGAPLEVLTEKIRELREEVFELIAERNRFMIGEAEAIIAGVERMMETGAGNARFMAQSLMQAFQAMTAAGMPLSEILESIGSAMRKLSGREFGGAFGEEFARFGEMLSLLSEGPMKRAIEQIEAMGSTVEAVGNLGLLTGEQFGAFGRKINATFNRLVAGGLTSEEALAALKPQLQQLLNLSEQYGFKVRGATAELLEQAKAQGLVASQGMTTEDILIAGFDRMLMALNAIIEALGGVPIAFEQWTEAIEETGEAAEETFEGIEGGVGEVREGVVEAYDTMSTAAQNAANEAYQAWVESTGGVAISVQKMVTNMNKSLGALNLSLPSGNPAGGGGRRVTVPGFQHGTPYTQFGEGTLAALHGMETVVTLDEGETLLGKVAEIANGSDRRRRGDDEIPMLIRNLISIGAQGVDQRERHHDRLHDIDKHLSDRARRHDRPFESPPEGGGCS